MRCYLNVMKQMQNQLKRSTTYFLNTILNLPRLNFLTLLQNAY